MNEISSTNIYERGNIDSSKEYFLKYHIPKDAHILDIGCRYGTLLSHLKTTGYIHVFGIDIDENSIRTGRSLYPEISKNLFSYLGKNLPFNEKTFDVVLMFDVLEHIPNVNNFLQNEVHRVLKVNGIFIFQTPNKLINIPWEIINQKSLTKFKDDHCSLQTKRSLLTSLKNAGFSNIIIETYNIFTPHNLKKMRTKIGFIAWPLLFLINQMPPNFKF